MSAIGKRYRRGLVVGKFCPLHRGHMVVIQSAIDACDQVVVISYTKPDFEACGRTAREAWIKTLFPQVRVLDAPDRSPSIQGIAR
jgi:HTH-type transcriptional repressor of NAD biosynthesis genes